MDVGEKLGKYDIRGTLGRGAMGVVYDGWDPLIERRVAIKTVPLLRADHDPEAQEGLARFRREAQAAGRLQHPNIVAVYDYGETPEFAYLVMEFVDGRTLKSVLDAQERFSVREVARVMGELLDALQYSHDHGVVHRDVKPANMILTRAGRVKVADFGVARIESSNMTQVGTVIGTPAYMSPEQLAGQTVDSRTDIYSAGVVLYQLLTGDRPYHGSNLTSIYHQALNSDPVPPSKLAVTVPEAFDPVVARAMAKRPADRYAGALQFAEAIRAAAVVRSITPAPAAPEPDATVVAKPLKPAAGRRAAERPAVAPAAPAVTGSRGSNRTALAASAAAAVLLAIGAGAWYATRPAAPVAPAPNPNTAAHPAAPARTSLATVAAPEPPKPAPATPAASASQPAPASTATKPPAPVTTAGANPPPASAPGPANPAPPTVPLVQAAPTPAPSTPVSVSKPPAPQAAPPAAVAPVQVAQAPGAIRNAIAAAVAPVDCALVSGDVAASGAAVSLVGVAGRGPPVTALHRAVNEIAPTAAVDWRVASFDGPYCRALDVLHPAAAAFGTPGSGFMMSLRSGNRPLTDGELITVDLTTPSFPAWLLVDYLQHDGTVVHLHPTAKDPARSYPPRSHPSLGDPATGGARWEVGTPYGVDMIVAVASSSPLFTQNRKELEQTDVYLRALQAAIEAAQRRNERLAADALVLTTEPRH